MAAVRHDLVIRPAIAKLRLSLCVSRKLHFSPQDETEQESRHVSSGVSILA